MYMQAIQYVRPYFLHYNTKSTQEPSTFHTQTYVDLMVMHRSCSSFRVSVKRVSPALELAMIPALLTRESVRVDFPWSTWAITDMLRMFFLLSMIPRIWSTVKFTWKQRKTDISKVIMWHLLTTLLALLQQIQFSGCDKAKTANSQATDLTALLWEYGNCNLTKADFADLI